MQGQACNLFCRSLTSLSACTMVLLMGPAIAAAKATATITPRNATVNVTIRSNGTIQGSTQATLHVTRTDRPTGVLQSCDKVERMDVQPPNSFQRDKSLLIGSIVLKPSRCSFSKSITYKPFTDTELKAACAEPSHTVSKKLEVWFRNWNATAEEGGFANYGHWVSLEPYPNDIQVTAHVTCQAGASAAPATSIPPNAPHTNVRPVNACNLSGNWNVWQTAPGRQAAIPFVLTANQGHSDIYQVSAPNSAGVSGSAIVNGHKVTMSLQGDNGARMQSFSGAFDRSCSTLSGQTVRSDAPLSLTATRRGGGYTTQSVHSSRSSRPAKAAARPRPAFGMPHVNTRVAPKWNLNTR